MHVIFYETYYDIWLECKKYVNLIRNVIAWKNTLVFIKKMQKIRPVCARCALENSSKCHPPLFFKKLANIN